MSEEVRFGDYIKGKRLKSLQEFTITQLARHLNVSRMYYCDVENGRRVSAAERFCNFMAVEDV